MAVDDEADFDDIGEGPLKIAEVVRKALVEVSEAGTEAAAASGRKAAPRGGMGGAAPQPKVFKADRLFSSSSGPEDLRRAVLRPCPRPAVTPRIGGRKKQQVAGR